MTLRRRVKSFRRYLHYLAVRSLLGCLRLLPYAVLQKSLSGLVAWLGTRYLRGQSEKNLLLAFGQDLSAAERERIIGGVARNLGRFVAETVAMKRRGGGFFDRVIDPGDLPQVGARLLAAGKGAIGVTGHVGNWELLAHHCARLFPGRFCAVVANRLGNRWMNALVERERAASRLATIYQEDSPRKILRVLAENNSVGIVPDQDVDAIRGTFVDFFGKPAYTPTGPAWLAVRSGAPILPLFLVREGRGLRFLVDEPIWPNAGATDEQAEVERITRAWCSAVERVIRKYPDQWVWFHRRWRTTPERLAQRGKRVGRSVQRA
jgi:KDO2-lipid IV(A) lauroyltransferase